MIKSQGRHRPSQKYTQRKFNEKVNRIKTVNKTYNQRGGIKL